MCIRPHFLSFLFYFPIIILVIASTVLNCNAQTFSLQQYTTEDGLPGTIIYSLDQDKDGVIWLSTDGGICKFNGQNFELFKNENIKGEVTFLKFDSQGRLWMIDLADRVYMYHNGITSRFDQYFKGKKTFHLFEDVEQNIWLCHFSSISKMGQIKSNSLPDTTIFTLPLLSDRMLPFFLPDSSFAIVATKGITFFKNNKAQSYTYSETSPSNLRSFPYGLVEFNQRPFFFSTDRVYSIDLEEFKILPEFEQLNDKLDSGIKKVLLDKNNNLWFATRNGVLYNQRKEDGTYHTIHLMKGDIAFNLFQDEEKNIWIIMQDGLYKLPSDQIRVYQDQKADRDLYVVNAISDQEIITGNDKNTITIFDRDFNLKYKKKLASRNERIYGFAVNKEKTELSIAANFGFVQYELPSLKVKYRKTNYYGFKTCRYSPEGRLWFGSFIHGGYFEDGDFFPILKKRTYAILPLGNKKTWFGTVEGLYYCNDTKCNKVGNELLEQDIRDIQKDKNEVLWIATQSNGIVLFKDGVLKHITTKNGLAGDNCQKIFLDQNYAWIATTRGISKINRQDFTIKNIRISDGLPSNDVRDIHFQNENIYAATSRGLAVFKNDFEVYSLPPILSLKSIQINNTDTLLQEFYKLPHTSNNIKINFTSSSFKNTLGLEYQYLLKGLNDDWVSSSVSEANFSSLPPGDYSFFVKTKTPNSDWSKEKTVSFFIEKPYWQTYWFYGITFSLFFLAGVLFFYAIVKEFKRRNDVQKKLMQSQLTALRAQMNPHFLFNSLNSIQEFIITNDKRSANYYLSRFSRLVRNILNTSSENEIRLKKEIETLQLYLDLEALRFEKNFEHIFEIDENLDIENIYIPSMLIQPYVENAIKHGLMHKGGMRKLFVRFFKKENLLICEVEDNGVGRERAREIQKQNRKVYKSKAMSLTKERIDLLNSSDWGKLDLDIIDLKNKNNEPLGTKVIIQVQIKLKK